MVVRVQPMQSIADCVLTMVLRVLSWPRGLAREELKN